MLRHSCLRLSLVITTYSFLSLAVDATTTAFIPPKFKDMILSAPVSEYPRGITYPGGFRGGEHGVYRLKVNPKTGGVDEVSVVMRASQAKLNATVIPDFFKWKFQPGRITSIDIPVEFERDLIRPESKNAVVKN